MGGKGPTYKDLSGQTIARPDARQVMFKGISNLIYNVDPNKWEQGMSEGTPMWSYISGTGVDPNPSTWTGVERERKQPITTTGDTVMPTMGDDAKTPGGTTGAITTVGSDAPAATTGDIAAQAMQPGGNWYGQDVMTRGRRRRAAESGSV